MSLQKDIDSFLNNTSNECWDEFRQEMNTDENKDYRRGFKAGLLCASLRIQSKVDRIKESMSLDTID